MLAWLCRLRAAWQGSTLLIALIGSVTAAAILVPQRLTSAQNNPQAVTYDQPITGSIDDANFQQVWTLSAPATDRLSVDVQRTGGDLVPGVQLLDSTNKPLATADHDNTYARSTIASTKLPSPGMYSIVVSRNQAKQGKSSGSYSLVVSLLGAGVERSELYSVQPEPLPDGVTYNSELSNAKWIDVWHLQTFQVTHIQVVAQRLSSNLVPTLHLFNSNGKEIQHADADPTEDRAQLDAVLTDNSDYQVRVARQDNADGNTTGKYSVVMTVLGGRSSTDVVAGEVKAGTAKQGQIRDAVWQETWVVRITQPTRLSFAASRLRGTLIPALQILDSSRKELIHVTADEPFTTATISNFAFAKPGSYLIVVYRADGALGATTGEYQLVVMPGKP